MDFCLKSVWFNMGKGFEVNLEEKDNQYLK